MLAMTPYKKHRVILTALSANLLNVAFGTCLGWSSPVIPKLKSHNRDSPLGADITQEEEGWIASIITLGSFCSCLIGGPLGSLVGRKWSLFLSSLFYIASFVLLLVTSEVWMIYLARALQGVSGGITCMTVPVFVGEIATDDVRASLGSLMALHLLMGIIYVYCIGPYVSYITLQWFCLAIPLLFLAIFPFMPESPYFYAAKHKRIEGITSLKILRGVEEHEVEEEMTKIQANVNEALSRKSKLTDILGNRGYRKALFICCGLLSLQQLSGTSVVTFNSQSIFSNAKSTIDPPIATIILGVVQLVSNFVTPFVVQRSGHKIVLLISACGMCLTLVALGTYFYMQAFGDASGIAWIPVPALVLFNLLYSFGFGPLPWAVLGEILPVNVKPIGTSIACATGFLTGFLVTRWFPELNALGPYYAFWIFGSLCAGAILFIVFAMFETKGLSFEQIEKKLHYR